MIKTIALSKKEFDFVLSMKDREFEIALDLGMKPGERAPTSITFIEEKPESFKVHVPGIDGKPAREKKVKKTVSGRSVTLQVKSLARVKSTKSCYMVSFFKDKDRQGHGE